MTSFIGILRDGSTVWWSGDSYIGITDREGLCDLASGKYPSRPVVSPDTRHFVYIAPSNWESQGNLYLWRIGTSKSDVLVTNDRFPSGCTPKRVVWLDNEMLLMIVGYAFGSITLGGSIFWVGLDTGEVGLFATPGPKREYTDLEVSAEGVNTQIVEFDDNWLVIRQRQVTFARNQIERKTRRKVERENHDF